MLGVSGNILIYFLFALVSDFQEAYNFGENSQDYGFILIDGYSV